MDYNKVSNVNMPNASNILSSAMGLRSTAVAGYTPSAALQDYTGDYMANQYSQNYGTGLTGSSIAAENQAKGISEAYDADQNTYLKQLYGIGTSEADTGYKYNALNTGINEYNTAAKTAAENEDWELPLQLGATVAGSALGGVGGIGLSAILSHIFGSSGMSGLSSMGNTYSSALNQGY